MANGGALAVFDDPAMVASALEEISAGALTKDIASRYGATKQSLRAKLIDHPGYKLAVSAQAECLVEDATEAAIKAPEMVADDTTVIARARLRLDAAHRWAAARDPERWAQRPASITINNNVLAIGDSLVGKAAELLDQLRVCNTVAGVPVQQPHEDE